jgi:hypothetical protein
MEDLYRSGSCEPLAQKLAGKLSFARGTAAQRVKQRKEFVEHGVIARSERRCWIQRMKAKRVPCDAGIADSRIVDYRYSLDPLSTAGSVRNDGGRFNIGAALSPGAFTAFPALYVAEDYPTAFLERFGSRLLTGEVARQPRECAGRWRCMAFSTRRHAPRRSGVWLCFRRTGLAAPHSSR